MPTKTNDKFRIVRCSKSQISGSNEAQVRSGYLYFTTDTNECFYDNGGRHRIGDIEEKETEQEITNTLVPLSKIYFAKDTNRFWKYINDEWERVNFDIATTTSLGNVQIYDEEEYEGLNSDVKKCVVPNMDYVLEMGLDCGTW